MLQSTSLFLSNAEVPVANRAFKSFFEWESLLENAKIELAKERFCWQGEVLASAKKNKQNKNKNK